MLSLIKVLGDDCTRCKGLLDPIFSTVKRSWVQQARQHATSSHVLTFPPFSILSYTKLSHHCCPHNRRWHSDLLTLHKQEQATRWLKVHRHHLSVVSMNQLDGTFIGLIGILTPSLIRNLVRLFSAEHNITRSIISMHYNNASYTILW